MKTEEEIEQLAEQYIKDNTGDHYVYCGFVDGYTQCQKDNADNFLSLIEEYREKELPNKDVPYHYEAEIDSGLKYLIMFIKNKQD
jgi:hypothetical protein